MVMSHVLSREKREQVIALGRLGWSLRRIEQATGVRRETASDYLRGAGIALRRPGGWGRHGPSNPAINPITDSDIGFRKAAINLITDSDGEDSKPAIEVTTDFSARQSGCGPASRCEPYGELIALELDRGRNAMGIWQDLVDSHGFGGGYQIGRPIRRVVFQQFGTYARCIYSYDGCGARIEITFHGVECHANGHLFQGFVWSGEGMFDHEPQVPAHSILVHKGWAGQNLVKVLRDHGR